MKSEAQPVVNLQPNASELARRRLLSTPAEPLLMGDWHRVLMIHFEVDAKCLQRDVPFPLDDQGGCAYVSLVAFTMRNLRPRWGGRLAAALWRPIATHHFLNVRTYVRVGGESGIHFLMEWVGHRLASFLGGPTFSLPYRFGIMDYHHHEHSGSWRGNVIDPNCRLGFAYSAVPVSKIVPCLCRPGSLDEWFMERYIAFNGAGRRRRYFRVWHDPWRQFPVETKILNGALLGRFWPWWSQARMVCSHYSPGLENVWMGRPHGLRGGVQN